MRALHLLIMSSKTKKPTPRPKSRQTPSVPVKSASKPGKTPSVKSASPAVAAKAVSKPAPKASKAPQKPAAKAAKAAPAPKSAPKPVAKPVAKTGKPAKTPTPAKGATSKGAVAKGKSAPKPVAKPPVKASPKAPAKLPAKAAKVVAKPVSKSAKPVAKPAPKSGKVVKPAAKPAPKPVPAAKAAAKVPAAPKAAPKPVAKPAKPAAEPKAVKAPEPKVKAVKLELYTGSFFQEVVPGSPAARKTRVPQVATATIKKPKGEESHDELIARIERELLTVRMVTRKVQRAQVCTKCCINPVEPGYMVDRDTGYCAECAIVLGLGHTREARQQNFHPSLMKSEEEETFED